MQLGLPGTGPGAGAEEGVSGVSQEVPHIRGSDKKSLTPAQRTHSVLSATIDVSLGGTVNLAILLWKPTMLVTTRVLHGSQQGSVGVMRSKFITIATCFHPQGRRLIILCQRFGWTVFFTWRVTQTFTPIGSEFLVVLTLLGC